MGRSDRDSAIARMAAIFSDVDAGRGNYSEIGARHGCSQPYVSRVCRFRRTLQRGHEPSGAGIGTVENVREAMRRVARQRRGGNADAEA